MPRRRTSYVVIAAIFIILEVAAIAMLSKSSDLHNIWLNKISHRVMTATWKSVDNLQNYFSLGKQNEDLALENFELREQVRRYEEFFNREGVAEAARAFESRDAFNYTPARIVNLTVNTQHNTFAIDKGSLDGIVPYSGVISGNGVVGIIDAVDKHFSYGRTLMNSKISISARVGRDGIVAPLEWDGLHSDGAILRNLAIHSKVEPGDTLWTSGHSKYFPPYIPIGIAGEKRLVDGAVSEVDVTLFQDFRSLRYVTVVGLKYPEETENME